MRLQQRAHLHALRTFLLSVRLRLTLWYLGVIVVIMFVFGGSLYAAQTLGSTSVASSQLEEQLRQESQRLQDVYAQMVFEGKDPTSQTVEMQPKEIVLLLNPDGAVLDTRGPLTSDAIRQLQVLQARSQTTIDITIPRLATDWHDRDSNYHILVTPIRNQQRQVATLMVGLIKTDAFPFLFAWLWHGMAGLVAAALGGYWLAGKVLYPVKMITSMANEINATDLRRRLHLRRKDEFGKLAATFDQMLARLEAAFKRQTQFTADASHELRTPLTIIDLEINRALTQLQTPEEYRQVLGQIQDENEQMTAIVNKLLFLARADTGQMVHHQEEVDLSDIALACVERLLPLAQQHRIALSTGDLPELIVMGDAHYLGQMLTNLLENAIKYTSGIGTRVHVHLASEQERWGVLQVQDDGAGIAEEHLPYLFDRFYRVDKARTREVIDGDEHTRERPGGSGLGLAIVQWIVQAHGGDVRVESTIGEGSTFDVRLPLFKSPVT